VYYTLTGWQSSKPQLGFSNYHHIKAIPQKLRSGQVAYHHGENLHPELDVNNPLDATIAKAAAAAAVAAGKPLPKEDDKNNKPMAPLEFIHVPYTGGQAITKAAANAGMVWGACHFAPFLEWDCPVHGSGDYQHDPMQFQASYAQAQTPWLIPTHRFLENPLEGTKRFTVVRHPYSRAISFYRYTYDKQHGYPYGFKYHDLCQRLGNKDHPPLAVAQYLREREHPAKLNAFLQNFLIRSHHPHKPDGIELIPQVNFVYYRGIKYVHHVLHYEFLQRDFKNILEKYDLTGLIDLPPPDRKRKRKKQFVKPYEEKRIPQETTVWTRRFFFHPLARLLGLAAEEHNQPPPVVDMSLAEIEDEYLLGAQDLANETIAMLNTHFELDFRKFHYAKIKVNATTDAYWNPIQSIPRESPVAKQQSDRNHALNKQRGTTGGGGGGEPAAPAAAKPAAAATDGSKPVAQQLSDFLSEKREKRKKEEDEAHRPGGTTDEKKGQGQGEAEGQGEPDNFQDLKARVAKRHREKRAQQEEETAGRADGGNGEAEEDGPDALLRKAEDLNRQTQEEEQTT